MGIQTNTYNHHMNTSIHTNIIQKGSIRLWMKSNEKKNDIHPASPGCRPGTYPQNDEEEEAEEELPSKQTSRSRQSVTLPEPATVVVVICEPRGLSNPITMGSKTIKA